MFSKKKFLQIGKINALFLILLLLIKFLPVTLSKYQSSGIGNVNSNIAFYLLDVGKISKRIEIDNITPRKEGYVYQFTISNQKDERVSEVDMEYVLSIVTTTNLPLRYELYENVDEINDNSINLIGEDNHVLEKDQDGTYFQKFTFSKEKLYFSKPQVNNYTLIIYFDEEQEDAKYQGMIELVEIDIDSSQIVEE